MTGQVLSSAGLLVTRVRLSRLGEDGACPVWPCTAAPRRSERAPRRGVALLHVLCERLAPFLRVPSVLLELCCVLKVVE